MEEESEQRIHLMDSVLASQVAAGEVVERPASVVKELVENSIDAGARSIRVEIRRGGISLLKVSDDGSGMSQADASMCLLRHATSKLTSIEHLFAIQHLGFRGEALPSIASVSHLQLTTRRPQDVEGTRMNADGGELSEPMNAGCAPGTVIEVSQLFYNTPVRRKFLKSEETEAGHVEHQLKLHALAFPEIRFTYLRDGQLIFDVASTHDLRQRIADFIGRELAEKLMRIRPTEMPGVRVTGFLMPLSEARRNRRMQYFFLNGRPIDDKIVMRAVRDGYGGFPTGLHPALFLYLEVEPGLVDVNVHPAKREVRFRRPSEVTTAVLDAVAATLAAHARGKISGAASCLSPAHLLPSGKKLPPLGAPAVRGDWEPPLVLKPVLCPVQQELELPPEPQVKEIPPVLHQEGDTPELPSPVEERPPQEDLLTDFRHIGTLGKCYAVLENREGMVLMSPHAARERIIFERLMESRRRPLMSQRLLIPEMLEIDARDEGVVREVMPQLEQAGFRISPFGQHTLRVEAVPALLPLDRASDFLQELLGVFTRGEVRLNRARHPFEPFAMQLAQQYARQEGIDPLLQDPMPLLADLLHCEIPYCTPRGKPTLVPLALSELRRKFQAQ